MRKKNFYCGSLCKQTHTDKTRLHSSSHSNYVTQYALKHYFRLETEKTFLSCKGKVVPVVN